MHVLEPCPSPPLGRVALLPQATVTPAPGQAQHCAPLPASPPTSWLLRLACTAQKIRVEQNNSDRCTGKPRPPARGWETPSLPLPALRWHFPCGCPRDRLAVRISSGIFYWYCYHYYYHCCDHLSAPLTPARPPPHRLLGQQWRQGRTMSPRWCRPEQSRSPCHPPTLRRRGPPPPPAQGIIGAGMQVPYANETSGWSVCRHCALPCKSACKSEGRGHG